MVVDKSLVRSFRENLRRLERIIEQRLQQESCCYGVGVAQCHTLLAVEKFTSLSLRDLAEYMQLDKSTLSRTVDTMVQVDLLSRTVAKEDRRAIRIALTQKGQTICDRINTGNDSYFTKVMEQCGGDPQEIEALFSKLVAAMAMEFDAAKKCNTKG